MVVAPVHTVPRVRVKSQTSTLGPSPHHPPHQWQLQVECLTFGRCGKYSAYGILSLPLKACCKIRYSVFLNVYWLSKIGKIQKILGTVLTSQDRPAQGRVREFSLSASPLPPWWFILLFILENCKPIEKWDKIELGTPMCPLSRFTDDRHCCHMCFSLLRTF